MVKCWEFVWFEDRASVGACPTSDNCHQPKGHQAETFFFQENKKFDFLRDMSYVELKLKCAEALTGAKPPSPGKTGKHVFVQLFRFFFFYRIQCPFNFTYTQALESNLSSIIEQSDLVLSAEVCIKSKEDCIFSEILSPVE